MPSEKSRAVRLDLGLGEVAGEGALRDRVARPAVDHAWHSRVGRR